MVLDTAYLRTRIVFLPRIVLAVETYARLRFSLIFLFSIQQPLAAFSNIPDTTIAVSVSRELIPQFRFEADRHLGNRAA